MANGAHRITMKLAATVPFLLSTTMASASFLSENLEARGTDIVIPSTIHKRSCAVRQYGCEDGYCWQKCNQSSGAWCWLAFNGGNGGWVTCKSDADCKDRHDGNPSCANPEKAHGGCSC
jgi:hypothetical protein